jgi:hypothetical protein
MLLTSLSLTLFLWRKFSPFYFFYLKKKSPSNMVKGALTWKCLKNIVTFGGRESL